MTEVGIKHWLFPLKDTSIVQRTQESNPTGSARILRLLALNIFTVDCSYILGWNDAVFGSLPRDL